MQGQNVRPSGQISPRSLCFLAADFSCFALASLPISRASFELHYSEMLRFSRLCHGFGGGYFLSVLTGLVITSRARTLTFPNNSPVPLVVGSLFYRR